MDGENFKNFIFTLLELTLPSVQELTITLLPARLIGHHNLNISDTFFSDLQLQLVEADHIRHLNIQGREGREQAGRRERAERRKEGGEMVLR